MTVGSYDVSTIAGSVDREILRLNAQIDLFWPSEITRYRERGLGAAERIVELGCGSGHLLRRLRAERPDAELVGVEIDPLLVEHARRELAADGLDVEIVEGSILELPLPEASFDLALVRLVLEHVPDPPRALAEVHRILRPGGSAVVVDNDFELHLTTQPAIPELRELYDAYCRSREAQGGRPRIGRELPLLLRGAGFVDVTYDVVSAHSTIVGDAMFLRAEGVGIPARLVRDGHLASHTLGTIARRWRDMLRTPEHAVVRQLHLAAGTRAEQGIA